MISQEKKDIGYIISSEFKDRIITYYIEITPENTNWIETHEKFKEKSRILGKNLVMMTPMEYFDFLKFLRKEKDEFFTNPDGKTISFDSPYDKITKTNEMEYFKITWVKQLLEKRNGGIVRSSEYKIEDNKLILLNPKTIEEILMENGFVDIDSFKDGGLPIKLSDSKGYKEGSNVYCWGFNKKDNQITCCWVFYGFKQEPYFNCNLNPNMRFNKEGDELEFGGFFEHINVNIARVLDG